MHLSVTVSIPAVSSKVGESCTIPMDVAVRVQGPLYEQGMPKAIDQHCPHLPGVVGETGSVLGEQS